MSHHVSHDALFINKQQIWLILGKLPNFEVLVIYHGTRCFCYQTLPRLYFIPYILWSICTINVVIMYVLFIY